MLLHFRIALLKLKNRFLIRPVKLTSMIRLIKTSKMIYRKFCPVKIGISWKQCPLSFLIKLREKATKHFSILEQHYIKCSFTWKRLKHSISVRNIQRQRTTGNCITHWVSPTSSLSSTTRQLSISNFAFKSILLIFTLTIIWPLSTTCTSIIKKRLICVYKLKRITKSIRIDSIQ